MRRADNEADGMRVAEHLHRAQHAVPPRMQSTRQQKKAKAKKAHRKGNKPRQRRQTKQRQNPGDFYRRVSKRLRLFSLRWDSRSFFLASRRWSALRSSTALIWGMAACAAAS